MDASDSPAHPDFSERPRREDGTRWNYAYNDRSEVTGASKRTEANGQVPGLDFGYEYDGIGNRTKAWSGTAGTSGSPTWEYTSNALNQYTGITYSGHADILTRSDEPVTATATGATAGTTVKLDQFHAIPLVRASTDATHGRLSTTTVRRSGVNQSPPVTTWFPPANRVTGTGGKLAYDADGNLLTDGRWNYTWDGENRLVKMDPVTTNPSNGITSTSEALNFAYDWMGRRIGKTIVKNSVPTHMAYAYDHWNPAAEWQRGTLGSAVATTDLKRTHLWGLDIGSSGRVSSGRRANFQAAGGVGGLIASTWHTSSTVRDRYIPGYDANGNIISWSCVSGTLASPTPYPSLQRRDYDPFGNAVLVETFGTGTAVETLTANLPDFGFSTKLQDKQTGLYYYGYRYYDPVSGRWPSRDPLGEDGGMNLYGFVWNSAVGVVDALGLAGIEVIPDCGVKIFAGHGLSGLTGPVSPGSPVDKSQVPTEVMGNPDCSAGHVIGCNTGYYVKISNPINTVTGRPYPMPEYSPKDFDASGNKTPCELIEDAFKAAKRDAFKRICKSGCCSKVKIEIWCYKSAAPDASKCKVCKGGYSGWVIDCKASTESAATSHEGGADF